MSRRLKAVLLILLFAFLIELTGCGETVRGMGRDLARVGRGIKTIFISD
ncbi:MAG: hypothetical protein JW893_00115 [Candidatus Omnitrophica bacterium]|nr:hypothetical protein [Candidatus Omnitrophota bacterium]